MAQSRNKVISDKPHAAAFMSGTWVTSFATFVHDDPPDSAPTPRLVTYSYEAGSIEDEKPLRDSRSTGYMLSANLLCLKFRYDGTLLGKTKLNRGGNDVHEAGDYKPADADYQPFFGGDYSCDFNDTLGTYEGEFSTLYKPVVKLGEPERPDIYMRYYYVASGRDELAWLWLYSKKVRGSQSTFFRGNVTSGILKRVTGVLAPPT